MPTYSYRCSNCDTAFDQYQAFTDDTLTVCPNCGEPKLRKVFNSIGVTFNGSGFYRNDSRSESSKSGSGSSASSTIPATKTPASTPASSTPAASSPSTASPTPASKSSSGS